MVDWLVDCLVVYLTDQSMPISSASSKSAAVVGITPLLQACKQEHESKRVMDGLIDGVMDYMGGVGKCLGLGLLVEK